jgi:ribose transport system substrate-binding protein
MKKKLITIAAAAWMSASSLALAEQPDWLPKDLKIPLADLTIGFTNLGVGVNGYTAQYQKTFDAFIAELGVKVVNLDSGTDPARQGNQVQDLIAQKVDVMIIWPVSGEAIVPFAKQAKEAGIPVIITNSNIDPSGKEFVVAYTGPDHIMESNLAGGMMVEALGGKGNVVMINGLPGYTVSEQRIEGFMNAIKDHPEIKVLDSQPANWSQEKAQTLMENYITRFGDQIDGVYCAESGMCMGAYAAIQAAVAEGRLADGDIKQTDATMYQSSYDLIKQGKYYGSVYQSPDEDAKLAIKTAILVAQGVKVPDMVWLETPVVTAKNIDSIARPSF